jgi:peptidoglycan hydrolase FlgJ
MAGPVIGSATSEASLAIPSQPKPKNAADAAKQFEALLIGQMLRTARESGADGSLDEDSTSETMFDLAGQQFAQMLANHGGFGLAKLIAKGLASK